MGSNSTPLLQLRGRSIWEPVRRRMWRAVLRGSCLWKYPLPHLPMREIGVKDWSRHPAIPCGWDSRVQGVCGKQPLGLEGTHTYAQKVWTQTSEKGYPPPALSLIQTANRLSEVMGPDDYGGGCRNP